MDPSKVLVLLEHMVKVRRAGRGSGALVCRSAPVHSLVLLDKVCTVTGCGGMVLGTLCSSVDDRAPKVAELGQVCKQRMVLGSIQERKSRM